MVNGSVKGVGAYGRGTNRPVYRMFGLARVNHDFDVVFSPAFAVGNNGPVSYTHLTLPTICSV